VPTAHQTFESQNLRRRRRTRRRRRRCIHRVEESPSDV